MGSLVYTDIPAIAGLAIRHAYPAGFDFIDSPPAGWSGSEQVGEPVTVRHVVEPMSTAGLTATADLSPLHVFYRGADGSDVVRYEPVRGVLPAQTLRTIRPGYEFAMHYDTLPESRVVHQARDRNLWVLAMAQRHRGLLAHAVGFLLPSGRGVVCPGISGAGKTTLASLLVRFGGGTVPLSDDRIAVTEDANGFRLWGTPWHGDAKIAEPAGGPLGVVAFPRKSPEMAMRRLDLRDATRRWLNTLTTPLWSAELIDWSLEWMDRLVRSVPHVEIAYPATLEAAEWIVKTLTVEAGE